MLLYLVDDVFVCSALIVLCVPWLYMLYMLLGDRVFSQSGSKVDKPESIAQGSAIEVLSADRDKAALRKMI